MKKNTKLFGFLIALFLLCLPQVAASKRSRNATREEVAQTWIGLSSSGSQMIRLSFRLDGTGTGAISSTSRTTAFRILSWTYNQGKLDLSSTPVSSVPFDLNSMSGRVLGYEMSMKAKGSDWELSYILRPEAELEATWNELRSEMNALGAGR